MLMQVIRFLSQKALLELFLDVAELLSKRTNTKLDDEAVKVLKNILANEGFSVTPAQVVAAAKINGKAKKA